MLLALSRSTIPRIAISSLRPMSTATPTAATTTTPTGDVEGGPITKIIIDKVQTAFQPSVFAIYNDSHKHAHHASMRGSTNTIESHFRLEIVSDAFAGKPQPARHRLVYGLFKEEMATPNGIHALSLKTKTNAEYAKQNA